MNSPSFTQSGRSFTAEEITHIKKLVKRYAGLSMRELAETICEHLSWQTASGGNKRTACLKLLDRLQSANLIDLKNVKRTRASANTSIVFTERTARQEKLIGSLSEIGEVKLTIASDPESKRLWNEYVSRYHYLGYKKPFGNVIRYFVKSGETVLGSLLTAGASKRLALRDEWIGWTQNQRINNLPFVINNTRFLIFPWIEAPHLSSHVLGILLRRVRKDYSEIHNFEPLLIETFVDPALYKGTCYKASNWIYLGLTEGINVNKRKAVFERTENAKAKKMIFVYPLVKDALKKLCSEI